MTLHDRIFASVFPPPSEVAIPTPAATPVLGSSGFGESFGSQNNSQTGIESSAAEQIKWDRAWHTATTYLSLPDEPIDADHDDRTLRARWIKPVHTETRKALEYVLSDDSRGIQIRKANDSDDLLRWYFEEVVLKHYIEHALPGLIQSLVNDAIPDALFQIGKKLHIIQNIYLQPLRDPIVQILGKSGKANILRFEVDLHGLFTRTLPQKLVTDNLAGFFKKQCSLILVDVDKQGKQSRQFISPDVHRKTLHLVQSLQSVGLAGYQAQRIFAEVMSDTLSLYIKSTYAGQWSSPSPVVDQLRDWIENRFSRFIVEILAAMKNPNTDTTHELTKVTHADVERWQEMGVNKLGALRTDELFSVVVDWDESKGAIEDLKRYVTVPSSRTHLTSTFSSVVSHRLLQPGASTTEILQVYISIIRGFTALDPKGVLLDRVARPIRRYLRERDDTVTIVVGGLLADPDDEPGAGDALLELALEMSKSNSLKTDDDADNGELDFDDMTWMPDPVDAGPEYKKSKNSDVIGSLISLFDSKDVFVKEFQNILGERLLKKEYDFDKEIRVLELLKLRFGEAPLQACEVMLRDILDSRRVDTFIHKDQQLNLNDNEFEPKLHTRILSHLFWPSLHSETFFIPPEITSLQSRYATGFETLKQSRKLTWLHALGQVNVTLDFEDRTVSEEVQTWQASVIYAFQPAPSEDPSIPVTRTYSFLSSTLSMTDSLLHNALTFWIGKLVLKQTSTSPPTYTVIETLSDEAAAQEGTTSAAIAAAAESATAATAAAVLSEHEVAQEKMEVYWQYVVGMLTNGGAMPLQQIVMMLRLTVPGGFPFGNEELKEYLEMEVREGRLDFGAGNYRIKH